MHSCKILQKCIIIISKKSFPSTTNYTLANYTVHLLFVVDIKTKKNLPMEISQSTVLSLVC